MPLEINKPNPDPVSDVVTNLENNLSCTLGSIPVPLSLTLIITSSSTPLLLLLRFLSAWIGLYVCKDCYSVDTIASITITFTCKFNCISQQICYNLINSDFICFYNYRIHFWISKGYLYVIFSSFDFISSTTLLIFSLMLNFSLFSFKVWLSILETSNILFVRL